MRSLVPEWGAIAGAAMAAALATRVGPRVSEYSQDRAAAIGLAIIGVAVVAGFVHLGGHHRFDTLSAFGQPALPMMLCVLTVAAMPLMSIRSLQGLRVAETGRVEQVVQMVTDPAPIPGSGFTATLLVSGKRLRSIAYGSAGRVLGEGTAGSRFRIVAQVRPWDGAVPAWAISKHLAGRATIRTASPVDHGSAPWRAARWVRLKIATGARGLPPDQRALFGGFVLGDNRGQDPAVADDFRAAGLSHLLVVSGQNVAFVLTAANPLLRRLSMRLRALAALSTIAGFALLTRFEPSVLRASMMAALVVLARASYRPQEPMRVLSLAVLVLLLIDPLLTWSMGFGLSVCATAGLAVLAGPLEDRLSLLGMPAWAARPLSSTLAAQIGTYPLLLGLGGVSPISLPANLLALPAAEPLMVWGVIIGLPAGLLGHQAAVILHLVDRVLIWWVAGVARFGGHIGRSYPLPNWWPAILCALIIGWSFRGAAQAAFVSGAVVLGLAAVAHRPADVNGLPLGNSGAALWRSGPVTMLLVRPGTNGAAVLQSLRAAGVDQLSAVVLERPTNALWTSLGPVVSRYPPTVLVICGAPSALGATAVTGLQPGDVLQVQTHNRPWALVRCNRGRAEVVAAATGP